MLRLGELIFLSIIILMSVTEFFIPLIFNKPFFGSFRKSKPTEEKKSFNKGSLDDKIDNAKEKVKEVKAVQSEISEHFKTAEQLKEESDNLLK